MKKIHFQMTNKEFAITVKSFKSACLGAGTLPTARQAAKWRKKKGKAYQHVNG